MSVTEKRSDIAILQVLGLTTRHLLAIFLGHGLVLAIIGIAAGALMGVGLAVSVSDFLSGWNGFPVRCCLILLCITSVGCHLC